MLKIESITYSYDRRAKAVEGLSAGIPDGVTLLAGPNAGGKTTLLRILAGLLEPNSGCITLRGEPATPLRLRQLSRMVMQDADPQILGARVGDDVMLGEKSSNWKSDFAARARGLCDSFGLGDFWDRSVQALSYGQKRKLCLVHALAAGPEMLLLDEPFAGLDYPSGKELRHFIRENRRNGLRQIISTHELEPVFDLADHVVVVADGRAPAEGAPETLREKLPQWSIRKPGEGWTEC